MEKNKLRSLQLAELEILKEFIRICEENNLKYYVCGGTALGAVRHNGFIPWDDDIDVFMPRKDYEKFKDISYNFINKSLRLSNIFNNKKHFVPFYRINDVSSKIEVKNANIVEERFFWIDIFPIDGLPESKLKIKIHSYRFLFLRGLFQVSVFNEIADKKRIDRPIYERVIIWLCDHINLQKLFNIKKRFIKAEKLLSKYDFYKSEYVCCLWGAYKLKDIYPASFFGDGVKMPFEDIEVVLPQNYHEYLKCIYGDYMKLPPEDKRGRHDVEIIDVGELA